MIDLILIYRCEGSVGMGLYHMKNNEPLKADDYFVHYLELQPDAPDRDYIEYYRTRLKAGRLQE